MFRSISVIVLSVISFAGWACIVPSQGLAEPAQQTSTTKPSGAKPSGAKPLTTKPSAREQAANKPSGKKQAATEQIPKDSAAVEPPGAGESELEEAVQEQETSDQEISDQEALKPTAEEQVSSEPASEDQSIEAAQSTESEVQSSANKQAVKPTTSKKIPVLRLPRYFAGLINQDQRIQIQDIQLEYHSKIAELEEELKSLKRSEMDALEQILTPSQRKLLEKKRLQAQATRRIDDSSEHDDPTHPAEIASQ